MAVFDGTTGTELQTTFEEIGASVRVVALATACDAQIAVELPDNAEKTVALRKLLESKDAAVRAQIYKDVKAEG